MRALCVAIAPLVWSGIVACGSGAPEGEEDVASESLEQRKVDAGTDAHDAGTDAHDAGTDAHDAGTDAHDAGTDAHDAGTDAHDAGTDAHDAGTDAHDAGTDAHDAGTDAHDAGTDAHDAGTDAHDAGVDASCGNCDDSNPCTTDACNKGTCTHTDVTNGTACSTGNDCTVNATCTSGVCSGGTAVVCTASDQCHVAGTCNPSTGVCSNPIATNGTTCNDGNACTTGDVCASGACGGTPVSCTASDQCHAPGTCNVSTGVCSNPTLANGTACNDGNLCTTSDVCTSGTCAGSAVVCAASDACHTAGACNVATGACSNPAAPSGVSCGNNSNLCVGAFLCDGNGSCVQGPAPTINTSNPCVIGTCVPATGVQYSTIPGCGATTDQWQPVVGRPSPRDSAAGAFLPAQKALVLFGGANAGAPLADTWTLSRATGLWSASYATGPTARAAAAVAFDSGRQRVVLFGGLSHGASGDTYLADTWEYDPVAQAWSLATPAASPPARAYASMAFDSGRGKTDLFGGRGASGAADGGWLWEWDGTAWTQRTATSGPLGRATSAMVYDSARARFVLFGGETVATTTAAVGLGDTWELDPSVPAWASIAAQGAPPARFGHAMYFDATRSKTVLFGGTSRAQPAFSDTWEYDGPSATWTARATPASPAGRAGHVLAFDPSTGHGLLVGGVSYSSTGTHTPDDDDTWELDPIASTWTPRTVDSAPALYRPGIVYDTARSTFVLRGAETRPVMWELAGGRWTAKDMLAGQTADFGAQLSNQNTGELATPSTVYDPVRQRTLYLLEGEPELLDIFTGQYVPATIPQIWEWDGSVWTQRVCSGGPASLQDASITYDTNRSALVVVGGTSTVSPGRFMTWEVDSATCTWNQRTPVTSPSPRNNPNVAWDSKRNVVVLFGGGASSVVADTWEWDGAAGTWTPRVTATSPPPRIFAGAAFDPTRAKVVLFGGQPASPSVISSLGDLWEYDGAAGVWSNPQPSGGPPARDYPSVVFDPTSGRTLVFGGNPNPAHSAPATDSWLWDGTSWTRRLLGASPVARSGASGGWIPESGIAVLFGGVRGDGDRAYLQDTWIWQGGEWSSPSAARVDNSPMDVFGTQVASTQTPSARAGHAFAAESVSLLFGGQDDQGLLGDTWRWSSATYAWTPVPGVGPPARVGHAMAATPGGASFVLFGGTGVGGTLNSDTWIFSLSADGWSQAQLYTVPPARTELALATDPIRQKVVLFGGLGASGPLQDTWEYDITGGTGWSQRTPSFSPPARFGHAMFYDPNRGTIILLGGTGSDPSTTFSDVYEWDGQAGTWMDLPSQTPLGPRAGAVAFFDAARGQQMVCGGLAYGQGGADVATYGDTVAFSRANELGRNGVTCSAASACSSGLCVDGHCCNVSCTGQCAACDLAGSLGTCTAIAGTPHGSRAACAGGACPMQCDGTNMNACAPPPVGTSCGSGSCASVAVEQNPPTCDVNGVCQPSTSTTSCVPYACTGGSCSTECEEGGACAPGAFCALYPGGSYLQQGACEMKDVLASFTASPASPVVGSPVTLSASVSVGDDPYYTFTYTPPGGEPAPCGGFSTTSWCAFTPTVTGSYTVTVTVIAGDESSSQPDDSQSFAIAVAAAGDAGAPADAGTLSDAGTPADAGSTSPDSGSASDDAGSTPDAGPPFDDAAGTQLEWGNTQPLTGTSSISSGYLLGFRVAINQAGTVTALGLVPDQAGTSVQLALYSDFNMAPQSLVAETGQRVISGTSMQIPVTTPTAIAAGDYWIMAIYDSTTEGWVSTTPTPIYYLSATFGAALPATLTGLSSYTGAGSLDYFAVTVSP